jgi:hypothetical protein
LDRDGCIVSEPFIHSSGTINISVGDTAIAAMTSYATIRRARLAVADKYLTLVTQSEENREKEFRVAMLIRRTWKAHRRRQELARRHAMATKIQKTFRRHLARLLIECLRVEDERKQRELYFNRMATRIQSLWRGYQIRHPSLP